eukprot:CAMPEP_0117583662 /NCGR_PEP_ID=MMETSP0784-20121206/67148_1 /TAXON_ID=39447 /ORGANISM="" /LENGTH=127 /DNA_ID=CAMNT_0005384391 /DNA_START=61 /DNA_END=444 /DNA_ORIENTATION=-
MGRQKIQVETIEKERGKELGPISLGPRNTANLDSIDYALLARSTNFAMGRRNGLNNASGMMASTMGHPEYAAGAFRTTNMTTLGGGGAGFPGPRRSKPAPRGQLKAIARSLSTPSLAVQGAASVASR